MPKGGSWMGKGLETSSEEHLENLMENLTTKEIFVFVTLLTIPPIALPVAMVLVKLLGE